MSKNNPEPSAHIMVKIPVCPEVKFVKRVGYVLIVAAIGAIIMLANIPQSIRTVIGPYVLLACVMIGVIYVIMAVRACMIQRMM
jgi:hypothetical protein